MKDFILLVKAVSASSIEIMSKKRNGKARRTHRLGISQIISAIMIVVIFCSIHINGLIALKQINADEEIIFQFVETSLSAFSGFSFFISLSLAPSIYFKTRDEVFLPLPISGERLFLARTALSLYISLVYSGGLLFVSSLSTCLILSLGPLSYFYSIAFSFLQVFFAPFLSFFIVSLFSRFLDFKKGKFASTIFSTISGLFGGVYLIQLTFAHSGKIENNAGSDFLSSLTNLFRVNAWIRWNGYLPAKFTLLSSNLDGLFFLYFALITIALGLAVFLSARHFYQKGDRTWHAHKKRSKRGKEEAAISKEFSRSRLVLLKREFSLYRHNAIIFVMSFLMAVPVTISLISTSIGLFQTDDFASNADLRFLLVVLFFSYGCFFPFIPFSAISLEKKQFAFLKSLPLENKNWINRKLAPSFAFTFPFILALFIAYCVIMNLPYYFIIAFAVYAFSFSSFLLLYSFYIGCCFPNFNYDSPSELMQKGIGPFLVTLPPYLFSTLFPFPLLLSFLSPLSNYSWALLFIPSFLSFALSIILYILIRKRFGKLLRTDFSF